MRRKLVKFLQAEWGEGKDGLSVMVSCPQTPVTLVLNTPMWGPAPSRQGLFAPGPQLDCPQSQGATKSSPNLGSEVRESPPATCSRQFRGSVLLSECPKIGE